MAVFSPKDSKGDRPDAGLAGHPSRVKGQQFTLAQVMKAVALVAVGLAILRAPELSAFLCIAISLLFVAAGLYALSKLPPRVRLVIVLTIAVLLLIGFIRMLRLDSYDALADSAEDLASRYSALARQVDDPRSSAMFLRESARFSRLAHTLQSEATWRGLIRFIRGERLDAMDGRQLALELELPKAEEECKGIADRMGIRLPTPR